MNPHDWIYEVAPITRVLETPYPPGIRATQTITELHQSGRMSSEPPNYHAGEAKERIDHAREERRRVFFQL